MNPHLSSTIKCVVLDSRRADAGFRRFLTTRIIIAVFAIAAALMTIGCAGATSADSEKPHFEVYGRSNEGRAIKGVVLGKGRETYLMLGVVHGNEPLGEPLLLHTIDMLRAQPSLLHGRRVVIIPVVNPDGLAHQTRTNAKGVDINRNFPSQNWQPARFHGEHPASELETAAVLKLIRQFKPTRIMTIHSPLDCVNYDGPAENLAERIAAVTPYPLRANIGYPTPGSLGSYAGHDLRTPTITLELRENMSVKDAWNSTRPGLVAFLQDSTAQGGLASSEEPGATSEGK